MKELRRMWQLGIGAGMLFGFGSTAMEVLFPEPAFRTGVKAALLCISGVLILLGYSELRTSAAVSVRDSITSEQGD